jgi:hypothetical protein
MTIGPEDWQPQEPSGDFVDRVMARIGEEHASPPAIEARRRRSVRAGVAGAVALAAGVALAVGWHGARWASRGDATASAREEVHLGARAIAVLEPGAHVAWNGDDVEQPAGDVFYRVEPGGSFHVHTPAGNVAVLGTCFRVQVEGAAESWEAANPMNGRDMKAGAVGAALAAAALVTVYEGKVAVSLASERVTLTAGESARASGAGVARTGGTGGTAADGSQGAGETSDPLVAANENLVDTVRDYKTKLEALEAQKAAIAKQLSDAQQKLATAQGDGQAAPQKSPYDLTQDDWKEMAAEGKVVSRTPCESPGGWTPTPAQLANAGLAPGDAQAIHDARADSYARTWGVIRPLCVQALQGDAKVADRLGSFVCTSLVSDIAKVNGEDTDEELRAVAEIRAGLRPYDASALGTYGKILYVETGETQAMEQQLAQSIGPADAHSFVYADTGCWSNSSHSVGPRPTLPPK